MANQQASAGHKLGQLIGDWWEEFVVLPLLQQVADELELFLDHRFISRSCRESGKIIWRDSDGNRVDYDFVLELGGSQEEIGVPVGFAEVFWRRGARHSKDKARDDSGKLMPMRETYPTARFLGIAASGEFTKPARRLVQSREIDLFFVPKGNIMEAFEEQGLVMDYPDKSSEETKAQIAEEFERRLTPEVKKAVADNLFEIIGEATVDAYVSRVRSFLAASPREIRFVETTHSDAVVFETIHEATDFLADPSFSYSEEIITYRYEITYSDGYEFTRDVDSIEELCTLHTQLVKLANHMEALAKKKSTYRK